MSGIGTRSGVLQALDRHQRRRDQGIPTLSVLAGATATGVRLLSRWAATGGRTLASLDASTPEAIADAVLACLSSKHRLSDLVTRFVASKSGAPAAEVRAAIASRSDHEIELYLARALPRPDDLAVRRLCLALLARSNDRDSTPLHRLEPEPAHEPWSVLEGLLRISRSAMPALAWTECSTRPHSDPSFEAAAKTFSELAQRVPWLPVAIVAEKGRLARFLDASPPSRVRTLVLEGLLDLASELDGQASTRRWLDGHRLPPAVSDRQAEAAAALDRSREEPSPERLAGARSAAEAFLHAVLEALADTAGRFVPNATVDADFGPGGHAQVDLLARSLRIALEIDGYHHFRDPEAYRRDRRKDLALQKAGCLVLRFLAEDVVERLEDVLDAIRDAIVHQQSLVGGDDR